MSVFAVALLCALLVPAAAGAAPSGASISWLRTPANFAHAMGGLTATSTTGASLTYTYTNTLEAFEQNYAKGYRIFEVDLIPTADGGLAARHDWSPSLYTALGERYPGHVPTTAEFLRTKVFGKYTPIDINVIVGLMRTHPDMYVITDTKYVDAPNVRKEFGAIIRALGSDKATLSNRFIVQIYQEQMLKTVRSVYPFANVLYSLYWQNARPATSTRAVQFAKANGIRVLTFDMNRWSKRFVGEVRAAGIAPAVNTINDPNQAAALNAGGVRFLYSDTLPNRPWWASLGTASLVPAPLAPDAVPFNPHDD